MNTLAFNFCSSALKFQFTELGSEIIVLTPVATGPLPSAILTTAEPLMFREHCSSLHADRYPDRNGKSDEHAP